MIMKKKYDLQSLTLRDVRAMDSDELYNLGYDIGKNDASYIDWGDDDNISQFGVEIIDARNDDDIDELEDLLDRAIDMRDNTSLARGECNEWIQSDAFVLYDDVRKEVVDYLTNLDGEYYESYRIGLIDGFESQFMNDWYDCWNIVIDDIENYISELGGRTL